VVNSVVSCTSSSRPFCKAEEDPCERQRADQRPMYVWGSLIGFFCLPVSCRAAREEAFRQEPSERRGRAVRQGRSAVHALCQGGRGGGCLYPGGGERGDDRRAAGAFSIHGLNGFHPTLCALAEEDGE
jgi:hypothetical protein